jgi:hypothetical protein
VTSWFDDLRPRAGALAPAAEQFLNGRELARGPDGLVALCTHMEDWLERDDVDEEGERRFVEQAGALLGLLLIDHVGDAGHVARGGAHRVRLGKYGFFDPFAAVDRALDARDVRRALARQVALAEAESKAQGPLSRVVRAFVVTLQEQRPDLHVVDQFEHSLWLRADGEPFEVDLKRAVESTRDQSVDAVNAVVGKLLSMLPGAPSSDRLALDRLVPRLARADTLLPGLYARPLSEELVVALMVEERGRARYLRTDEVDEGEAYTLALQNLRERSTQARIAPIETAHGPLWIARTGDGRDSARVLLPSLHDELHARIGAHVLLGIPHRDTFYACDATVPRLAQQLLARTTHDFDRAPHKLSARAFTLSTLG